MIDVCVCGGEDNTKTSLLTRLSHVFEITIGKFIDELGFQTRQPDSMNTVEVDNVIL